MAEEQISENTGALTTPEQEKDYSSEEMSKIISDLRKKMEEIDKITQELDLKKKEIEKGSPQKTMKILEEITVPPLELLK